MVLTKKQTIALDFLEDNSTEEVLYGGAAGGAKTALGCYWQIKKRLKFPGSRGFIGRAKFNTLLETTVKTFFEVAAMQGLKRGLHFDLTSPWDKENKNCILFKNGSLIFLRDLFHYPSDPDFDDLGSLEITDAFVDECGQVVQKAKDTLRTRIRFGLEKYNLKPKILYATNPVKTWPYLEFYRPTREGSMPYYRKMVQAFVTDNPHAPKAYVDSLKKLPEGPQKQRLLYGNWEYDDDPATLIEYEKILDCFTNDFESLEGEKYITCDVARFGSDKTVIAVWNGFKVKMYRYEGLSVTETAGKIKEYANRFSVANSNIIADEDGVGGGVVDTLQCNGFVNNSRPIEIPSKDTENFNNLKSQCYFHLAERINRSGLFIDCKDEDLKQIIIQELEQVKQNNMDKDTKRQVLPKDKVKELIGRSPDFSDTLMMREYFELQPQLTWTAF
jgi:hypothetical protein